MATNQTQPTDVPVEDFLATVDGRRADEARTLIGLYEEISAEPPVMWGPSIIGFGEETYETSRGTERMPRLAFSPRKANLTLYFSEGFDHYGAELDQLGPHKTSRSCLYVTRLERIDLGVLRAMLHKSYRREFEPKAAPSTVAEYVDLVPEAARPRFDELRELAREVLPDAIEDLSYGLVGYRPAPKKRGMAFIGGFADHVSLYPVPAAELLPEAYRDALATYQRGKGTLWFGLSEPLPREFVRAVLAALGSRS